MDKKKPLSISEMESKEHVKKVHYRPKRTRLEKTFDSIKSAFKEQPMERVVEVSPPAQEESTAPTEVIEAPQVLPAVPLSFWKRLWSAILNLFKWR